MNILFLNRYRGAHLYGVECWMLRMAGELAARGHTVHLACKSDTQLQQAARDREIPVWPLVERYTLAWLSFFRLRNILRQQAIEVVCVKTWKEVFLTAIAGRGLGIRIFCRRGNNGDIQNLIRHRLAVTLCRPHILVPSAALAREFSAIQWMQGHPIHVVSHGVDMNAGRNITAQPGLPACRCRFVFVGRLSTVKGVDVLLRAWPKVLLRAPGSRLLMVGGHEDADYAAMARDLGIEDSIDFVGYQENVNSWIAASQVLVLPSRREGGGIVALEAMALGLPVIGSDVGGIPEYVENGQTGTIVPVADDVSLAAAMADLALAPERVRAQGTAGRQRMLNNFSLRNSVEHLEQVFATDKQSEKKIP